MHIVRNDYGVIFFIRYIHIKPATLFLRVEHCNIWCVCIFFRYYIWGVWKKVEKENQIFELVSFVNYLPAKLFDIDFFMSWVI